MSCPGHQGCDIVGKGTCVILSFSLEGFEGGEGEAAYHLSKMVWLQCCLKTREPSPRSFQHPSKKLW